MSLEFYPSLWALTRALEKNGASVPFPQLFLGNLLLVVLECGLLAGALSGDARLQLLAMGTWAVASGVTLGVSHWLDFPRWPTLIPFLGILPQAWAGDDPLGRARAHARRRPLARDVLPDIHRPGWPSAAALSEGD